jgi:oxaloacetate decarboxylase alpha subunit
METIVNLIYSVSPRHSDAYYAEKAREAAAIRPYRICFKDVGGLLTPERARTLIPVILQNAGDVPVEYHAHCNNGLAPLCYLEAVKLGIKTLHTAIPPSPTVPRNRPFLTWRKISGPWLHSGCQ